MAIVGAFVEIFDRNDENGPARIRLVGLLLLSFSVIAVFAGVVFINLSLDQPQGRYMYPAISAISTLMSVGITRVFETKSKFTNVASFFLLVVLFGLDVFFLFFIRGVYLS